MLDECKKLKKCRFFKKYEKTNDLACKGFIKTYCKGEKMHACKRREYMEKKACAPPDDMMPNGFMMLQS